MATGWEIFSAFWVLWKEIFHGSLCPTRHTDCSAACCKLCAILACDLNWLRDAVRIHSHRRRCERKPPSLGIVLCLPTGLSPMLGTQKSARTNQGHTSMQQTWAELAANSGSASSHLNFSSSNNLIIFFYADDAVFFITINHCFMLMTPYFSITINHL